MGRKPLIVGVDPGSTSAVAAVTLEGEIELLESGKNFPPRDIIERVIEVGKPVVVASDRASTPGKVEKISTSLGARLFEPEEDLSQDRKRELGRGANSHELDAVASAVNARKQLETKITRILDFSGRRDFSRAEVAEHLFSGEPLSELEDGEEAENDEREDSTGSTKSSGTGYGGSEADAEKQRMERRIENLESQVQSLKSELGEVKSQRDSLEDSLSRLRDEERKEIRKEEEVEKQRAKVKRKEEKIQELENEIEEFKVREKQYRKAIHRLFDEDYDLVPLVGDEVEEVPEKAVTRDEDVVEALEKRGCNIYHVERVEGLELKDFYVVESFPEPKNFESIIQNYRESR